ncbi:MAG TPA: Do family serine endopeptidase [Polyangiaceae bacterium]
MKLRKLIPLTALLLAAGTGCQHSAAAAASSDPVAQTQAPFATPPVLPGTPDIATLAARVRPAVVNITTVHEVHQVRGQFGFPGFGDLMPFFHQQGRIPGGGGEGEGEGDAVTKQQALGSGFLIDKEGHVVTNAHVIDGADLVKVRLADDREYRAKVIGKDVRLDVAVLKLENPPGDLPTTSLGSSEALRVGEYVVAIGNPFGLGNTVTMGIVSAKGRTIGAGPYDDFIQTDASINPGNSGGPLFNLHGQVVGINTAINPQGKGIGFAIPIDAVRDVVPQLLATGHVSRGRIGVVVQGMDDDLAKAVGLDHPHGALVEDVEAGSPGEKAGIRAGDVIVAVDGQDVPHSEDLPRLVARHAPGTQVKLAVLHGRQEHDVDVTLAAMKDEGEHADVSPQGANESNADRTSALGIAIAEEDGHVIVARVASDGPSDGKLRPGDVIEEIAGQRVVNASDLVAKVHAAATTSSGQPILLRVKRGDQTQYVAIEPRTSGGASGKN